MQTLNNEIVISETNVVPDKRKPFIEANTLDVSLSHLQNDCIIPVFSKDNESTVSHQEFISTALTCAEKVFGGEVITAPEIRTSHIVKGRTPSAIGKPVKDLREDEKTVYYERMMFAVEVPSISDSINGNDLSLTFGGVRAYNQENLYNKKTLEKFKFFIGFKNMVCCNMCISSDGYAGALRVGSIGELETQLLAILQNYKVHEALQRLSKFQEFKLSERQFAQFLGRCRMYNFIAREEKKELTPMLLNDGQISFLARNYYEDEVFRSNANGEISLWNFYNLLTGANKSSYIDTFTDRSVNAYEVTQMLLDSIEGNSSNWYLN